MNRMTCPAVSLALFAALACVFAHVGGALGRSRREIRYDYADVQPPKSP